jgi:N-methylhydantoinase B
MDEDIDPVTLEVLWSRLRGIPREMGMHLSRTAFSAVIKYARDFSTGLFTWDGRLLSQGVYAPGHLGSMPFMIRKLLENHFPPDEWEPGDVVLTNDPYINSGHLPDMFMFTPVFVDDELAGFCVIGGHQLDIGGAGAASYTMYVTDMYAEGMQIPPIKLHEGGDLNETVMDIIAENSRESRKIRGDLQAQYGAIRAGHDLYLKFIEEYSFETVKRYSDEIIARSEQRMREAIADIPDGTYSFEDKLDGFEDPLPVHATVTVDDTDIEVDFEGTADQLADRAINSPWQYTFAYTMLAIKSIVDPESPQTHGAVEPVTMHAPEGSILNARRPAPVASRQIVCDRVVSTVTGALNQAVPRETPAPGGQPHRQMFKFTNPDTGDQQVLFDGHYGGAGACPDRDGALAVSGTNNLKNTPVEAIETEYPLRITQYQLRRDSSGAGKYCGGSGTVREYELLEQADIQFVNERFKFSPFGVNEGRPSRSGRATYNPGREDERELHSKERFDADAGDVVRVHTPGGGGYGDPADRERELVLSDLVNGLISPEYAKSEFGYIPPEDGARSPTED